ncbi:MAG: gluconate:H+ symporter [Tissierellaceae bacterium]|nr:gluconate:H+ symporter [Tissierellaceae bacterium]
MDIGVRLVGALVIGLILVVFLILRTKVQAFPALLISAIVVGVIAGMPAADVMTTISSGFGSTLASIGIIIGLGVMMGKILEITGAAKKMALSILKIFGVEKTELVLLLSGWLVSIPVFCDSGFVILSELAKEFSRNTKKSMVALGCSLGIGLYLTHHLVPPTPGPLGVAGILGVDVGQLILWGVIVSALIMPFSLLYIRYISKKCPEIIPEVSLSKSQFVTDDEKLPSGLISFSPIIVPVILILTKTVSDSLGISNPLIYIFGNPITAVLIGVLISVYGLTKDRPRDEVVKILEDSLADAGLIICITGAGGALGAVLRTSGIGDYVANLIAGANFPAILVPMIMASLLKISQGSGTVAMITTASILAPMISGLGLSPIITTLAICVGPMIASTINDSYFWVVTRFSGMGVEVGSKAWTSTTAVSGFVGCVIVFVLSFFI